MDPPAVDIPAFHCSPQRNEQEKEKCGPEKKLKFRWPWCRWCLPVRVPLALITELILSAAQRLQEDLYLSLRLHPAVSSRLLTYLFKLSMFKRMNSFRGAVV
ncbi:hypothetical protein SRHO_G00015500 [Serrasalmus rhombeus]